MLERAFISGYRSCRETDIPLGSSIVALVGRNGVGKSNILRGLNWITHTVTSASTQRPWLLPSNAIRSKLSLTIDGFSYSYEVTINRSPVVSIDERIDINGSPFIIRNPNEIVNHLDNSRVRIRNNTYSIPFLLAVSNDSNTLSHIARLEEYFRQTHYYDLSDAWTSSAYIQENEYENWKDNYKATGNPDSSVLHRLIYMFFEEPEQFEEVNQILGPNGLNLLDFIDVLPLSQPGPESSPDSGGTSDLVYGVYFGPGSQQAGYGGHYLISDLSSGTRRILKIITYLIFDKRTLLLLEQPEDSVHFGLLKALIGYLRSYSFNSQVVFSTHSCEALNSLSPEEIRLVHSNNGGTLVRRLSAEQLSNAKLFLQDAGPLSDFIDTVYE